MSKSDQPDTLPEGFSCKPINPDVIKQPLVRPDPTKKISDEQWEEMKALLCVAEVPATEVAPKFGINADYLRQVARKNNWPTPSRIRKAQREPETLTTGDPALAVADIWLKRKEESRGQIYEGAQKALQRFFAHSPVPQSFAEAATAKRMMDEAIDPDKGKTQEGANVNLAILTQQGFEPRRAKGRVVE